MNHTALASKLSTTITAVQFITAKYPDVAFIIGEVGASLNPTPTNGATQNDYDLESVLGATLWNVDFMIYAMSQVGVLNFLLFHELKTDISRNRTFPG